jgi:hypothetical protein
LYNIVKARGKQTYWKGLTMAKHTFETGKTYVFYVGNGAHFRGLVVKRTAKTITVKFSDKGTCYLHRLLYVEEAANVKPTTLRIMGGYEGCEYAITRSAGKRGKTKVEAFATELAAEQM